MKQMIIAISLLAAQIATAQEFKPVATIYQNASGEQVIMSIQDDVKACIQDCIDSNERPGPELKQCVARCKR